MDGNGSEAETRVKFGPADWHTMPLEMAERVLMELRRTQPKRFGDVLAAVVTSDVNGGRS